MSYLLIFVYGRPHFLFATPFILVARDKNEWRGEPRRSSIERSRVAFASGYATPVKLPYPEHRRCEGRAFTEQAL